MKKFYIIALLLVCCTMVKAQKNAAATAVPKALIGHWQKGVFSLTSFEEPNGKYVGPANESSISYVIDAAGTCKEYFIYNSTTYNCRTQILGFRAGKLIMNAADNSFEFRPASGYYTTLTCMSKTGTKKPYGEKDLYPTYAVKLYVKNGNNGEYVLVNEKGLTLTRLQ